MQSSIHQIYTSEQTRISSHYDDFAFIIKNFHNIEDNEREIGVSALRTLSDDFFAQKNISLQQISDMIDVVAKGDTILNDYIPDAKWKNNILETFQLFLYDMRTREIKSHIPISEHTIHRFRVIAINTLARFYDQTYLCA